MHTLSKENNVPDRDELIHFFSIFINKRHNLNLLIFLQRNIIFKIKIPVYFALLLTESIKSVDYI